MPDARPYGAAGSVGLRPLGEAALARLVEAALDGATAAEVTPPISPGERWTPERVEWLRGFHRERRAGLDGPVGEATWALVEIGGDRVPDDERVVGAVRLRRTENPDVLEIGIWLVRDTRGHGVGREAIRLVLDQARQAGATAVRADTALGNDAARALLRSFGFDAAVEGERVSAVLRLGD